MSKPPGPCRPKTNRLQGRRPRSVGPSAFPTSARNWRGWSSPAANVVILWPQVTWNITSAPAGSSENSTRTGYGGTTPLDRSEDDLAFGTGKSRIIGNGTIEISRVNGILRFTGTIDMVWKDRYNFDEKVSVLYNLDTGEIVNTGALVMRHLENGGGAAQFSMSSTWTRKVEGTLRKTKVGWALENVKWTDSQTFGRPGGDPAR